MGRWHRLQHLLLLVLVMTQCAFFRFCGLSAVGPNHDGVSETTIVPALFVVDLSRAIGVSSTSKSICALLVNE